MIRRLLQIREGESRRALLLFTYLFLVIASAVITKANRDAIYQEKFGSGLLPYADLVSAVAAGLVMAAYVRIHRRVGLRGLLVGTLLTSAAVTFGFWFVARVREPVWMLPVLYVWASVTAVLLPAQVWTLANRLMTTREARRLFGIVSGGAICGGIVGGLVTQAVALRRDTADVLIPTAIALALCSILVPLLWRERTILATDGAAPAPADGWEPDLDGVRKTLATIWRSPHLRSVATLIGTAAIVTTIVSWQFKAIVQIHYPKTDERTAFYGLFYACAGVLALVTQLFVSSRLLRRFGVAVALLVVPIALITTSIGLLASSALWAVLLLRGSDQVIRYSIDKSTVELLYLPIPPRQLTRAKALIDTLVQRSGDGLGAALLVAVSALFISDPKNADEVGLVAVRTSVVTLVLLAVWIAAAISARRHYVDSLRDSIVQPRHKGEPPLPVHGDRAMADLVTAALDHGTAEEIVHALSLLEHHDPAISHPSVPGLLDHASAEVRRKAVAVLSAVEDTGPLARVEPLVRDPDEGVRAEALVYLSRCGTADPLTYLTELEAVHGSAIAAAIAHFLSRPGPAQNLDAVRVLLQAASGEDSPDRQTARLEAAKLIGSLPDRFETQLNALLQDPSPDVARQAIRAAAVVGKDSSIPLVIARLGDADLAAEAARVLDVFADRAIEPLHLALGQAGTPSAVRHAIPDVLEGIGTVEAERVLVDYLLDPDPVLRLRTISALNRLREQTADRRREQELVETVVAAEILGHYRSYQLLGRMTIGGAAMEAARAHARESMDAELQRIFRLMKLLMPDQDLHSAYLGLRSGQPVMRANALEFLDHALPPRFRTLLLPLIDGEVSLEQRVAIADRLVGTTVESSAEAMAAFAASDRLLRDAALEAEARLSPRPPQNQ
jgi:AAA family ATP:ADP antiporter